MDFFLHEGPLVPARAVAALIVLEDNRYLLQLRDQKRGIFFPGHWGLFGGAVEAGESAIDAVHRELHEELGLVVSEARSLTDFTFTFGRYGDITRHYFEIPYSSASVISLRLQEGAEMRAFHASDILNLPRLVPYDSFAIWLHASGHFRK